MAYGYRIMMTELCEIPDAVKLEKGCTQGFSEAPYLVEETVYYDLKDAEEALAKYNSFATGMVTNSEFYRIYGAREFYIEKIKIGENDRKLKSYGAIKYAEFIDCSKMDRVPDTPPVVKWCNRKNYGMKPEYSIKYKAKKQDNQK